MSKVVYLILVIPLFLFPQINFVNNASTLGLDDSTGSSVFGGSGASFVDFDNDGFNDITLATGDNVPVRFYKNINGQFFVEVSFFDTPLNYDYKTRSVVWVDYDNDGDKDFFLTSDTNGNRLFSRDGLTLTDVTESAGFPLDNLYTYGASWGDIDNDGCLDVYLSNRIGNTAITNYLFKNNCDGTFSEITNTIGLFNGPALTFCSGFFDFNNDGWQDLYVANDKFKPNYLYKNNGDGTFTDVSESSGTNIIMDAMSVTIDDFNSDGYLDIFITNTPGGVSTPDPGCVLFKNNGDETFTNVALSSGTDLDSFTWGSSFLDADNDGDLDLYVNSEYSGQNTFPTYGFFESNGNETFNDSGNYGFSSNTFNSYSSVIGDYDNNGTIEILVNNDSSQVPSFWENTEVTSRNYLLVSLEGTISNRDGIGSMIEISVGGNKQYRYVMSGEGYLSQNMLTEHFGIGNANVIDYVKVKWLSGIEDIIYNLSPNQTINIVEGSFLSVEEFNHNNQLSFFPNPAEDELTIQYVDNIESVSIYDVFGRQVRSNYPSNSVVKINLASLSSGTYIAKVKYGNSFSNFRFIKK